MPKIKTKLHKNSFKRFYEPGAVYFVVFKTQDNYPYFKEEIFCDLLIENLKIRKKLKGFKLYGFSIIYDHVNLLIQPKDHFNISQIIKSLKENSSRDINVVMGYTLMQGNTITRQTVDVKAPQIVGDTPTCRLRFDEPRFRGILNYSIKNLEVYKINFENKYDNKLLFPKFRWQKSFYDHSIRFNESHLSKSSDWDEHYDYTVYNHLKHGLPEDWKYTSLNYPDMIDIFES